MKIKQILKLGAAIVVCLNLASAKSLEQIKKDGVIRIGTMGTYAPFLFYNEKDELMRYDVEITRAVADKLELKPKFIEASWDAMLAAFDAGKSGSACGCSGGFVAKKQRLILLRTLSSYKDNCILGTRLCLRLIRKFK